MISLWILAQPVVESGARPSVPTERSTVRTVEVPSDALLPEPGTGFLRAVGEGKPAKVRVVYSVLTSAFHDGSRMTVADLLYPYIFSMRWGGRTPQNGMEYDPYIAKATVLVRERLAGLRIARVENNVQGFGELEDYLRNADC